MVRQDLGLFLVCDGMGGHSTGEVASALAVASLRNFFEATKVNEFLDGDDDEVLAAGRRLAAAVHKANGDVFEIATTHPRHRNMGCTLVAIYLQPPLAYITHLGDSRCYRLRRGRIEQLTRDHSLINDILSLKPDLTDDDLAHLPRNVVTRAIGIEPAVTFDVRTEELEPGDIFLLCSDGLTGMIGDDDILQAFELAEDPSEVSSLLVQLANEAGGHDNISVVIVRVEDDRSERATQPALQVATIAPEVEVSGETHLELSELAALGEAPSQPPSDLSPLEEPITQEALPEDLPSGGMSAEEKLGVEAPAPPESLAASSRGGPPVMASLVLDVGPPSSIAARSAPSQADVPTEPSLVAASPSAPIPPSSSIPPSAPAAASIPPAPSPSVPPAPSPSVPPAPSSSPPVAEEGQRVADQQGPQLGR